MTYDPNSPAESHSVLSGDINQIRENTNQLRAHESSTSEPSNLVAGMIWHDQNGPYFKLRNNANNAWHYILTSTQACTEGEITATPTEINNACDISLNGFFNTGTKIALYADTAPTGWTIQNTLDDKLVFITKGSAAGGQVGGAAHTTGSWTISGITTTVAGHTLTIAEIPAHSHSYTHSAWYGSGATGVATGSSNYHGDSSATTGSAGGGGSHSHGATTAQDGTWRPAAYCFIIISKN